MANGIAMRNQVRRYVVGHKVVKYLGKSESSKRTGRDEQQWCARRENKIDRPRAPRPVRPSHARSPTKDLENGRPNFEYRMVRVLLHLCFLQVTEPHWQGQTGGLLASPIKTAFK